MIITPLNADPDPITPPVPSVPPQPFTPPASQFTPPPAPPAPAAPVAPPSESAPAWTPPPVTTSPPESSFGPPSPMSQPVPPPVVPPLPSFGSYGAPVEQDNSAPTSVTPQPVVQVLSPRGVEYVFLTISLFTGAIGLMSALISIVNGKFAFSVLAAPVALLVVALPVFAFFFLRLKSAELRDAGLALDPSKRRSTQAIQIVSFIVSFFTLIGFVSILFAVMSGGVKLSLVKVILDVLSIEAVFGGILAYYWHDEHRSV